MPEGGFSDTIVECIFISELVYIYIYISSVNNTPCQINNDTRLVNTTQYVTLILTH